MDSWGLDLQMVVKSIFFYVSKKKKNPIKSETLSIAQEKPGCLSTPLSQAVQPTGGRRVGIHPVVMDTVALYPCGTGCSLGSLV